MKSTLSLRRRSLYLLSCILVVTAVLCEQGWGQLPKTAPSAPTSELSISEDPLGRTSPRGTVLAFLAAASRGNYEVAAEYLNTQQRGRDAAELAQKLAFILDHRLPAKLNEVSKEPEGSRSNLVGPTQELIGTIDSLNGKVEILLERVNRGKSGQIWLFSSQTLAAVPDLYDEINAISIETALPDFFLGKFLGVYVYGWLAFFIGLPLLYVLISLTSRLFGAIVGVALRRILKKSDRPNPRVIPHPIRLLVLAVVVRWSLTKVSIPLLSRQFWVTLSIAIAIVGLVWLFMSLSKLSELYFKTRLERRQAATGSATLIRPARRIIDVLVMFVGLLFLLHSFGVDPTAALAGLGVGGIAVALAAQKTLENMIGGASLIMDKAVRVGDFFKIGDVQGTVEEVGLRSTRVRTLDQTVVTIPNGQVASMTLENFSLRRTFWFHHTFGFGYDTTPSDLISVLGDVRDLLTRDVRLTPGSVRVRLLCFGQYGFDVEIFAYVPARDWPHFLQIQEELLLAIINLAKNRGVQIARPSHVLYLSRDLEIEPSSPQVMRKTAPGA